MKLIDFDGMFDEKMTEYLEKNTEQYTEKQWENLIPKLYKRFGDTYVAKVKCTPKQYYERMTDEELASTLVAHLKEDVPVSEFLCSEIEKRDAAETLLPLLRGEDTQAALYVVNLLGDDRRAFDEYLSILCENRFDEDLRSDLADIFRAHADEIKETAFGLLQQGVAKEYMLEILSRVQEKEDRIFNALLQAFLSGESTPIRAGYLAAYGDERALPYLRERIEDRTIGFVEFQELKYAIEALGGEYAEERDFSDDKDYIAVEAASSKASMPDPNTQN